MVTLRALGQCSITTRSSIITPRSTVGFALALRLIAERGRKMQRTALLELLWDPRDHIAAAHALSEAIYKLRMRDVDIRTESGFVWIPRESIVVDVFEAEDDWTGVIARDLSILPGYAPEQSAAFSDWLDDWRLRTSRDLATRILEGLAGRAGQDTPRRFGYADSTRGDVLQSAGMCDVPGARLLCEPRGAKSGRANDMQTSGGESLHALQRDLSAALGAAEQRRGSTVRFTGGSRRNEHHAAAALARARGFAVVLPGAARRGPFRTICDVIRAMRDLPGAAGVMPANRRVLEECAASAHRTSAPLDVRSDTLSPNSVRIALADLIDAVTHEQPLLIALAHSECVDDESMLMLRELSGWATTRPLIIALFESAKAADYAEPTDSPRAEAAEPRQYVEVTGASCT